MIKIETEKDLELLKGNESINPLTALYLQEYYQLLTREYNSTSLKDFGAIYVIENPVDCNRHDEIGLSSPLKQSAHFAELTCCLTIRGKSNKVNLLHSCFVLNDSYAVSVFAQKGILEPEIEKTLMEDSINMEVEIDV